MNPKDIEALVRNVIAALELANAGNPSSYAPNLVVPIGVSARHVHLCDEHVNALFGTGHKLTPIKELMGGQYACAETVTIVGLKLRAIENVRVLGPARGKTQVEISATDAVKLGISPPLRESGDIGSSAPIAVVGPKGAVYLNEGCIIAARHIHMSPADAIVFGVNDGDFISVETSGGRDAVLNNVKIRVHETFTLEMHLDTDEANACGVKSGDYVRIV